MCLKGLFWQISTSAYSMQKLQVPEWVCLQEIAMCGGLPPLSFANPPTHSGRRRREATKFAFFAFFFLLIISLRTVGIYKEYRIILFQL